MVLTVNKSTVFGMQLLPYYVGWDILWDIYLPKCTDTTCVHLKLEKLLQWPEDQTRDHWTLLYHLAIILAMVVQETAFSMAHNSRNPRFGWTPTDRLHAVSMQHHALCCHRRTATAGGGERRKTN